MSKADSIVLGDYLLTMDKDLSVINDGALVVKGNKIVDVGAREKITGKYEADRTVGGAGKAVIPGFINTHTHAAMVYMRGMADDLPLKEWLDEHIWPAENRWLSEGFVNDAVGLACLEMLKAGITTYNDMYFFEKAAASVSKRMGMRAVLGAGIIDFPTKTTTGADDCLRKADEFITEWKGDELISPATAPHSAYSCGRDTLEKTIELAHRHDVLIHTHLSETEWEVNEVKKKYGKTPGMYFEEIGFLSERVLAAHCIWVTEEEIEILRRRNVGVSHCPESSMKLASGIAPVARMIAEGIKVSLGTDGAASNNDLNMISEMSTAAKLHKVVSMDPTVVDARTVMLMATRWGAEALGLRDLGSLEKGKTADIVVIDLRKPHLLPLYNIYSQMVYALRASDVDSVMVNGRMVVDNGKLLSADENEILDRARAWGEKIRKG